MKTKFKRLVSELGKKSPDLIAKSLEKNGIKGQIGSPKSCPINRYLARELKVNHNKICVDNEYIIYRYTQSVFTPDTVKIFIDQFDRQLYRNLIK